MMDQRCEDFTLMAPEPCAGRYVRCSEPAAAFIGNRWRCQEHAERWQQTLSPLSRLPERAGREGESQPLPIPNDQPLIHDLVAADLEARKQLGIRRYGQALQSHNGRRPLLDLYEELLDACVYLKQALIEQEPA